MSKSDIEKLLPEKKETFVADKFKCGVANGHNVCRTTTAEELTKKEAKVEEVKEELFCSKGYCRIANSTNYAWVEEIRMIAQALQSKFILLKKGEI